MNEIVGKKITKQKYKEFWVKYRGRDQIEGIKYLGADKCRPNPEAVNAIHDSQLVIIAPGNPLTSIGPMLALKGIRKELFKTRVVYKY